MNDLTKPAAPARATAPREAVERLADFASEVDGLKNAFADPIHLAALRQAVTLMHDVAMAHDDAGKYGVYAQDDEPDDAAGADDAGWNSYVDLEVAEFEAGQEAPAKEVDAIDAFLAEWRAKKAAENRARLAASEVTS